MVRVPHSRCQGEFVCPLLRRLRFPRENPHLGNIKSPGIGLRVSVFRIPLGATLFLTHLFFGIVPIFPEPLPKETPPDVRFWREASPTRALATSQSRGARGLGPGGPRGEELHLGRPHAARPEKSCTWSLEQPSYEWWSPMISFFLWNQEGL